jgi:hypothetical protein
MVCKKISKGKCKIIKKQCPKGYEYKMGKKECSILKKGTKAKTKAKKAKAKKKRSKKR